MDKRKGIILAVVLFLLIGLGTFVFADEPNDDPGKNAGETNSPSDTNNDGSTTNPDDEREVQDEENSGTDEEGTTATNRRPSNSGSTEVIIGGGTGEDTPSTDNPSSDNGSNAGEGEENPGEVTEEPDTTAPVITINGESYQGKGNNIGYVNGDVILSLAEENLTVVVTKDGEELSFEDGMTLSLDGKYVITVTDEAGNVTEVEVSIDTTAPVLNFGNGKIVSEFTVEATDDNFDYMLIKYFDGRKDEIIKDNTFEISGLGDNTRYNITVYDKAGNTSEYRDIYLDNQKPIITGTGLNPDGVELENDGFYQSVSLKISDGSLKKVVRVNDDGTETELATFEDNFKNIKMLYENTFEEEGTYNIKAIDRNNNEESITFTIDRTAPKRSAANILVQGDANEQGTYYATYGDTIYAYVSFNDELAVAPTIEFVVDGKVFKATTTREETPNKDGKYIYYAYYEVTEDTDMPDGEVTMKVTNIKDKAGNTYADITEPTNGHVVYKDTNSPDRGYSTLGFEYTDSKDKTPVMEDGNKYYYVKAGDSFLYKIAFDEELQDGLIATIAGSELPLSFLTYSEEQGYVYGVEYVVPNGLEEDSNLEIVVSNIKDLAGNEYTDKEIKDTPTSNGRIAKYDNQKPNKTWLYILNVSDENNRQEIGKNQTLRIELNVNEELASDPMFSIDGQEIQTMPFYHVREDGGYIYRTDVLITDEIAELLEHDQNIPFTITNITDKAGNTISLDNDDATKHESAGYDQVKYDGEAPDIVSLLINSSNKADYHYANEDHNIGIYLTVNEKLKGNPAFKLNDQECTTYQSEEVSAGYKYAVLCKLPNEAEQGEVKFEITNVTDLVGNTIADIITNEDITDENKNYVIFDSIDPKITSIKQEYEAKEGGRIKVTFYTSEAIYGEGIDTDTMYDNDHRIRKVSDTEYYTYYYLTKDVTLEFTDLAGNAGSYSFRVDADAPVVTLQDSRGKELEFGWYTHDLYAVIEDENDYTALLNGEEYISGTKISGRKAYTLVVTDSIGNTTTKEFGIDKDEPAFKINGTKYNHNTDLGYFNTGVTVELIESNLVSASVTRNDEVMGVNFDEVFTLTEDGKYVLTATDKAGITTTISLEIDTEAPIAKAVGILPTSHIVKDGTEITINVQFTEQLGTKPSLKVEGINRELEFNNGVLRGTDEEPIWIYSVHFSLTKNDTTPDGKLNFEVYGYADVAGNIGESINQDYDKFIGGQDYVEVDRTAPKISIYKNGNTNEEVTDEDRYNYSVEVVGTDDNFKEIVITKDGNPFEYSDGQLIGESGNYVVQAIDTAGNVTVKEFSIDKNKPIVTINNNDYQGSVSGIRIDEANISIKDENIAAIYVEKDGERLTDYDATTTEFTLTEEGHYKITVRDNEVNGNKTVVELYVGKYNSSIVFEGLDNIVYDGKPVDNINIKIIDNDGNEVEKPILVNYYKDSYGETNLLKEAPTEAGNYVVAAYYYNEDGDYKEAWAQADFTIEKADLKIEIGTLANPVEGNGESKELPYKIYGVNNEDLTMQLYADGAVVLTYTDRNSTTPVDLSSAPDKAGKYTFSVMVRETNNYNKATNYVHYEISSQPDHETVISGVEENGVYYGSISFNFSDEDGIKGIYYDFAHDYQTVEALKTGGAYQEVNNTSYSGNWPIFGDYEGTVSFCIEDTLGNLTFIKDITIYKDHPTVINESLKTGEVYTGSIPFEFYDEDGIAGIYYDFENNYQTADDLIKNTTGIGALQDKGYYPVNAKSFKDTFKVFKTYNGTVSFCLVDTLGNKVFMNSITVNYLNTLNNN